LAAKLDAIITAGLKPDFFADFGLVSVSRTVLVATLSLLVLIGFGLRVSHLGAEGLSEDELNKLQAVADYREHGFTSANGEHPLLMKALQTGSIVVADKWNSIASLGGRWPVSTESALRFPGVLFGALATVLIYLVAAELFGAEVGLIAAALWAFDPTAIGLNRVAKEDTFLTFFFLLANVFWLRGQRVAESQPDRHPEKYYWATAVAFGAMVASKYVPQMIGVSFSYYWIFQRIPETRWRLGKKRLLICVLFMGATFLALNPTILLPATWKQMGLFAGQKLVGHDGYEFMGQLYSHRMTDWLRGTPWYFYEVFMAVKLPLLTVLGFLVGLPLLFRRKLGDGRYLIIFWLFIFTMMFSFAGGKFARYFTVVLPALLITSAIGIQFAGNWIGRKLTALFSGLSRGYVRGVLALLVVMGSLIAAIGSSPHFRLYTNALAGGDARQGYYFPHDEFYDASMRDAIFEIGKRAQPGARVASESQSLCSHYAQRAGRPDLVCVFLSDPGALQQLREGDFVIEARGRRYFSNDLVLTTLQQSAQPAFRLSLGQTPSASVYVLDKKSLEAVVETARRLPPLAKSVHPMPGREVPQPE
jgi:hypothetical protein